MALDRRDRERRSGKNRRVNTTWATEILRQGHLRMVDLFDDFDDPHESSRIGQICDLAIDEIRLHRALVEEILLATVLETANDPLLLADLRSELESWEALITAVEHPHPDDKSFLKAWRALQDAILRHVEHGEEELLRMAQALPVDFVALGLRMIQLREQILGEKPTSS